MCEDCFDKEYYGFPSQVEFEKFEEILDQQCNSGKVQILESQNEEESGLMDFRMYYKCNTCDEKYAMSIPDNAWRGYFLTEQKAIEYHNKLKESDKKKKYGCLIILILIIAIGIYSLVK
jgi:hypothetical protein